MTLPPARLPSLLSIGALALFALGFTRDAEAEEPTIDQIEYHPAELPPDGARSRVILVGAALTVGWYGASLGSSYLLWPNAPNAKDLRIPVVGPWMALGDVRCGPRETNCTTVPLVLRTALAVVSGVGQAGGLFAIVEGLLMNTGSAAAPASAPREKTQQGASWSAAPMMLSDGGGIELFGRF